MASYEIKKFILDNIPKNFEGSIRLKHENCSENKDAALVITKEQNGYLYICHRCGKRGFIKFIPSPEKVIKNYKLIKKEKDKDESEVIVILPYDFLPLYTYATTGRIPSEVFRWLYKYDISFESFYRFRFGWSKQYQRVIIPFYNKNKLLFWIGRCVKDMTKEERKKYKRPKYIIKKRNDIKHPLFKIEEDSNRVVIVEDILSSIKINEALNCSTIALLTTYLPEKEVIKNKEKEIILWLDYNMQEKMYKYTKRYRSFGYDFKCVIAPLDPKEYSLDEIKNIIGE